MPPKFAKSKTFALAEKRYEDDILDAYAWVLDETHAPDVVLSHMPLLFSRLKVPPQYTNDISECIQWFYDTANSARVGRKWDVARDLLSQLTISAHVGGQFDVSDVVDIDKLVKFCARVLTFRDNSHIIQEAWKLFVDAGGKPGAQRLTVAELRQVKSYLALDDISDSILIDMVGCGREKRVDFVFDGGLSVGIKGFGEILGQLGEFD